MSRARSDATRRGRAPLVMWIAAAAVVAVACALVAPAQAQPIDDPKTYAGDFWSRPRLTGDWGGFRDDMARKGVRLDADLMLFPQGVASGGIDTSLNLWGNAEYTLNLDTGKAGLWPGGFLRVIGTTGFGESELRDSGAVSAVNTAALLLRNKESTGLMQATFMQFLSPHAGLVAGKLFLADGFQGEFAGNYRTQFQNAALTIPLSAALVPISAYGGGVVILPWDGAVLSAVAIDPDGTATNNDVTEAFRDGVMVLAGGKFTIKPFGLVGHQGVTGMWSNKERFSLNQDPSNLARFLAEQKFPGLADPGPILRRILQRFFPNLLVPVSPANRKDDTWAVFYNFDQYLWQPKGDPTRGIGMFFTFGASDGNPNPIRYSYAVGIGGNGVVPGRPHDNFGVGWSRTEYSSRFLPFLRDRLALGLQLEDAVEMYYSAAVTPWLNVTADLQVIDTALEKTLGSSGRLVDVDPAVVAGLRVNLRF